MDNILYFSNRAEFRDWLIKHSISEKECCVNSKRGKPIGEGFFYIDAVEEALCFGWIDSVYKKVDGVTLQRFSPRKKDSPWTELNKERVRRLIKLGLMRKEGEKLLPPLGPRSFKIDKDIEAALKEAKVYSLFRSFPPLYQRVRAYNVYFYKRLDHNMYKKALNHLIKETKKGHMYGEWNDYGRLIDY